MPHRPGFLIPNAGDVAAGMNRQAEPDAGDFSVLGSGDYGILTGFDYTVAGGALRINTVSGINVAVIDGDIRRLNNSVGGPANLSAPLGRGTLGLDRFDLVVFDTVLGGLNRLEGTPDEAAPVFPFIPTTCVLIASVWVPGTITDPVSLTSAYVVDKRHWLLNGARGSVSDDDIFLDNRINGNPESSFRVFGDGTTKFGTSITFKPQYPEDGPKLEVYGGDVVEFQTNVSVTESLTVTKRVTAGQQVSGSNIISKYLTEGTPSELEGETGALFQDERTGRVYIKRPASTLNPDGYWAEIDADEYPPGSIVASILPDAAALQYLSGSWLLCDGRQVTANSYPRLRDAFPQWVNTSGLLTLPNLKDCFLGSSLNRGELLGMPYGVSDLHLTAAQLAPHTHLSKAVTGEVGNHSHGEDPDTFPGGGHEHAVSSGGPHQHNIPDPGHVHIGADHGSWTGLGTFTHFMAEMWGGQWVLDIHPADAGHGTVVDRSNRTMPAKTGITATSDDGSHSHLISREGDHRHKLNLTAEGKHSHALPPENLVGTSAKIENRPSFLVVNWYLKA